MIYVDKKIVVKKFAARVQVVDCFVRMKTIPLFSIDIYWDKSRKGVMLTIPWMAIAAWYIPK